ncbi:low density lipoprotein receptor adapter protein 1 isoform X1, partial [Lates japonicus]
MLERERANPQSRARSLGSLKGGEVATGKLLDLAEGANMAQVHSGTKQTESDPFMVHNHATENNNTVWELEDGLDEAFSRLAESRTNPQVLDIGVNPQDFNTEDGLLFTLTSEPSSGDPSGADVFSAGSLLAASRLTAGSSSAEPPSAPSRRWIMETNRAFSSVVLCSGSTTEPCQSEELQPHLGSQSPCRAERAPAPQPPPLDAFTGVPLVLEPERAPTEVSPQS